MRLGLKIEVACLDDPQAPWIKDFPLKLYVLGPSLPGYGYTSRLVPWLQANCHNYDFVVVNGLWQFNGFAAWQVMRKTGIPYFVFTHGMLDPWFKKHYPLKHLKKWLYWPWAEYRVLRDAAAVLFTCKEEMILARRSFWLYRCNEAVVNYGTAGWSGDAEAQRKCFLQAYPQLQGKRLILFLGRIHEKKGGDLLIEALHRHLHEMPDESIHLVMAGPDDGAFAQEIRNTAARLGLENRITWTGMIQGDLKWGAFQAAEVFILPSHQENFGISVAESLSASLPVLISNKVNIWREIEQDNAGIIENDDLPGTVSLLKRWFSLGEAEKEAMRGNARCSFLQHFEIMGAAKSLLRVYSKTLLAKTGVHVDWDV